MKPNMKPNDWIEWTPDCSGKQDYDGVLVSVSTRYWPGGGVYGERPSAKSQIVLGGGEVRSSFSSSGENFCVDGVGLAVHEFEADTEGAVKLQIERWVEAQFEHLAERLSESMIDPPPPPEGTNWRARAERAEQVLDEAAVRLVALETVLAEQQSIWRTRAELAERLLDESLASMTVALDAASTELHRQREAAAFDWFARGATAALNTSFVAKPGQLPAKLQAAGEIATADEPQVVVVLPGEHTTNEPVELPPWVLVSGAGGPGVYGGRSERTTGPGDEAMANELAAVQRELVGDARRVIDFLGHDSRICPACKRRTCIAGYVCCACGHDDSEPLEGDGNASG